MKIAVATLDGTNISPHFGRSRQFVIFEAKSGEIVGREVRDHASHHSETSDSNQSQHHVQAHNCTFDGLEDCEVVLCGGMGMKAAQRLFQEGIHPFMVNVRCSPKEAVIAFLAGSLPSTETKFCQCDGH